ncbi:MAG: cache domain-containing protein [Ignavibacteriaceae bacterium]|jgi:signal transduction histidine kinase|nr:cache domain-containing protein [Ignavibacteriaceae bacterium]
MKRTYLLILFTCFVLIDGCKEEDSEVAPVSDNLAWNKQIAVAYVHSYATVIGEAAIELPTDSARINFIRKAIDPISFYSDSSGYFYVYDYNCVNIAHARQKNLQGQNLYNYVDTKGKFVIRELASMAQSGGGYVEFYWIKPGETGEKKKLGYVEPIPNTNYFIGSGVYLE